jgi:hypothetical protein
MTSMNSTSRSSRPPATGSSSAATSTTRSPERPSRASMPGTPFGRPPRSPPRSTSATRSASSGTAADGRRAPPGHRSLPPLPLFAPALHDALMSDEQQPDPDGCPSRLVPHLCPNSPDACGCGRHTMDSATAFSQVRPGFLDKRGVQWTLSIALLTGRFGVQVPGGAPTRTGPQGPVLGISRAALVRRRPLSCPNSPAALLTGPARSGRGEGLSDMPDHEDGNGPSWPISSAGRCLATASIGS